MTSRSPYVGAASASERSIDDLLAEWRELPKAEADARRQAHTDAMLAEIDANFRVLLGLPPARSQRPKFTLIQGGRVGGAE